MTWGFDDGGAPASITLDPLDEVQGRALGRLASERIAWLTTVRANGFPHAVPVWFLWRDGEVIILSEPETVKARTVRANPKVVVHLESGHDDEQLTVLQGVARIDEQPASAWIERIGAEYGAKYASGLATLNDTVESMAARYSVVIRVRPTKLTAW